VSALATFVPPKGKPKPKHPGGRPSKYSAEFHPRIVYALARNGDTEQEIAGHLGVNPSTLTLWKKEHPEFSASLNKGRADVDANVENALLRRALGFREPAVKIFMTAGASKPVYAEYQEYYPPDVAAAFIWLKNRKPGSWRDRREVTGADGGPVRIVATTADEAL
jgi:transposase-like protein